MTQHLVSLPKIGPCKWCGIVHRTSGDCSAPRVGQVLAGKYRIVRLIGEGGVAAVYEARHIEVGRRFAVKFLRPGLLVDHQDVLRRFRREAQTEGLLECENVAGAIDFGYTERGVAYLVMDHLVGEDLARLLTREGTLTVARAAGILIQACVGLGAAHAVGIVHRDVKPANLFLCKHSDGSDLVKVLDFGIAKLKWGSDAAPSWTIAGWTMGTPCYMPPEQARGDSRIDHRADIYALGVILFEALSGARPHPGVRYGEVMRHLLTEPPTPIEALRPSLPPGIVAIVQRALASDPNDRYPSTDAMAIDLSLSGKAVPRGPWRRVRREPSRLSRSGRWRRGLLCHSSRPRTWQSRRDVQSPLTALLRGCKSAGGFCSR